MLIGFDDSGTVVNGETFITASVFIRPSCVDDLAYHFERWKDLTRRTLPNRPAEIKSNVIRPEHYKTFINDVVFGSGVDIWYNAFGTVVEPRTLEWGRLQRERYVDQYLEAITNAEREGKKKLANQYTTLAGWIRSTADGMMIKMQVLDLAVLASLNQAIVQSVLDGFDEELGELRWDVDMGFLKDKSSHYWQELLRSGLISATKREPIIHMEEWTSEHPFVKTFIAESRGPFAMFKPELRKRMNFRDSKDCLPVELADIFAGIVRKKYVDRDIEPHFKRIEKRLLRKEKSDFHLIPFTNLTSLQLPPAVGPNFYDEYDSHPVDPVM